MIFLNWVSLFFFKIKIPGFFINNGKKQKVIYLTIDDGPHAGTPNLFKWMNGKDISATHFWVGINFETAPPENLETGIQAISSHGYSHQRYSKLQLSQIENELEKMKMLKLKEIPGFQPYFRPPYGSWKPGLKKRVTQNGFKLFYWTYIFKDWLPAFSPADIEKQSRYWLKNGAVLVFHDKPEFTERLKESILQVNHVCKSNNFELRCLPPLN